MEGYGSQSELECLLESMVLAVGAPEGQLKCISEGHGFSRAANIGAGRGFSP
jgi:hypothetical protein